MTDADAILGLIDPDKFAGGSVRMDVEAARQALKAVGSPLGVSVCMAAFAVHEMVCESMASAARVHAIEKGKSIAEHTLIAFGGVAPLHVSRVAEKTGIQRILIPPNAGVGSAVGFLKAPIAYEIVKSKHVKLEQLDLDDASDMLEDMGTQANEVVQEGARGAQLRIRRQAFMRYIGQGHEIAIDLPDGRLTDAHRRALNEEYERSYANLFNRSIPGAEIEILSWSVLVSTDQEHAAAGAKNPPPSELAIPLAFRDYFDGDTAESIRIPVFSRDALGEGVLVNGPALITEEETTTYVSKSFDAYTDQQKNIVLQRKSSIGANA